MGSVHNFSPPDTFSRRSRISITGGAVSLITAENSPSYGLGLTTSGISDFRGRPLRFGSVPVAVGTMRLSTFTDDPALSTSASLMVFWSSGFTSIDC